MVILATKQDIDGEYKTVIYFRKMYHSSCKKILKLNCMYRFTNQMMNVIYFGSSIKHLSVSQNTYLSTNFLQSCHGGEAGVGLSPSLFQTVISFFILEFSDLSGLNNAQGPRFIYEPPSYQVKNNLHLYLLFLKQKVRSPDLEWSLLSQGLKLTWKLELQKDWSYDFILPQLFTQIFGMS